jgi:hypothetical protein
MAGPVISPISGPRHPPMPAETPAIILGTADIAVAIISAEATAGSGTPVILNQVELVVDGAHHDSSLGR